MGTEIIVAKSFQDMTIPELLAIAEQCVRDPHTLGGDVLDDDGKPTGHKMRGQNEARALARMAARTELERREAS